MTEFEWGTAAQWAGVIAALGIAIFGAMRQRGDKAIGEIKSTVDRMQASVDTSMVNLKNDFTASMTNLKNDVTASMSDLRADDARQFERIDKLESDVMAVEVEIKHLPSRDEFHKLDVKITEIGAKIETRFEALADKMDTVIAQNERAQDRLAEREDREREARR